MGKKRGTSLVPSSSISNSGTAAAPTAADVDAPVSHSPLYTLILRGNDTSRLSKDLIRIDFPNLFIAAFDGEFEEAESDIINSDRCADTSKVVYEYLSGYSVEVKPPRGTTYREQLKLLLNATE